jgi:predicted DCC family thiol-disulfide oxidoreductase YuxK
MQFEVFFDGDCPLCLKEIQMLRRLDRKNNRIRFTDIAEPGFNPEAETGLPMEELMAEIYGRMPNGELVRGMEVFRQLYGAVGLGFVFAPTKWPLLEPVFNAAYSAFAKNRLRLTGRCASAECSVTTT